MSKGDKIIEVLSWSVILCVIAFCLWIKYELSLTVS